MKQHRIRLLAPFIITFAMTVGLVQAQSPSPVAVKIPFSFTVGETTLPAGQYWIKPHSANLLAIQSNDGQVRAIVIARSVYNHAPEIRSKLTFNQYDGQFFLSEVWTSGGTVGRKLFKSTRERELTNRKPQLRIAARVVRLS
jgi:hypothetical protein